MSPLNITKTAGMNHESIVFQVVKLMFKPPKKGCSLQDLIIQPPNSCSLDMFGCTPYPGCHRHHQHYETFLGSGIIMKTFVCPNPELNLKMPASAFGGVDPTYNQCNLGRIASIAPKLPKRRSRATSSTELTKN